MPRASIWHDDGSDWEHPTAEPPTVWDDEPNPIIGTILGPDGEPLHTVRARTPRPMGYRPNAEREDQ